MHYSKDFLLNLYIKLLRARKVEEKFVELYAQGKIPGNAHSGIGEEATFVGACMALNSSDYMLPTHRGVMAVLTKGVSLKSIFCDAFGKKDGTNKGKGGIVRICSKKKGILGISGTQGGVFVIAVGAGLSIKILKEKKVVLAFFGDDTSNRGTFHESLNMASLWKLPIIFVCDNNEYGISEHVSKVMAVSNVADRAVAYSIPSEIVDGNLILEVYEATRRAVNRARSGEGPTLIEAKTYRIREHSEGGIPFPRPKEIISAWENKCPIKQYKEFLLNKGFINKEWINKVEQKLNKEIEEAIKLANNSKDPQVEDIWDGLYV